MLAVSLPLSELSSWHVFVCSVTPHLASDFTTRWRTKGFWWSAPEETVVLHLLCCSFVKKKLCFPVGELFFWSYSNVCSVFFALFFSRVLIIMCPFVFSRLLFGICTGSLLKLMAWLMLGVNSWSVTDNVYSCCWFSDLDMVAFLKW